jgi:transcriptional regulator NrdR family protein
MKKSKFDIFISRNIYIKVQVILLIMFIIFVVSCAKIETDGMNLEEHTIIKENKENYRLTYKEMIEDYDKFWYMLEENVPFALAAAENRGKNVKYLRNYYRNKIKKDTRGQEFIDIMIECTNEFNSSAHLRVLPNEIRNVFLQYSKIGNFVNDPKSQILYNTLDLSVNRMNDYFPNEIDISGFECIDESIYAYISKNDNVAYIRFEDFYEQRERVSNFINFYKKITDYDNLIIDVRNNPGGNTDVWKNCVVSLLSLEDIQYEIYAIFNTGQNTSLHYIDYNPNNFRTEITEEDWIYNTEYFNDTYEQNYGGKSIITKSVSTVKRNERSINYQGKIWLLIDEKSFSAADAFSYFCKLTKFATIVGTPSRGNGVTTIEGLICFYTFQNSGMIVRYFPFMGFNTDGSSNVERGDIPDVYTEEDALKVCLELIRKEN